MKMRSAKRLAGVTLAVSLLVLVGCSPYPKKIATYDDVIQNVDGMTVMPPVFTLAQIGAFSAETLGEMCHDIETELKVCVEEVIAESPFDLASLATTDEALGADNDLREAVFRMNEEWERVAQAIAHDKSKTIDVDYDEDVDYVADLAESDYILFVRGYGAFKTTGAQVKGAIMAGLFGAGSGPSKSITLEGMLVDANRGKVLWLNRAALAEKDPRKPRDLLTAAQRLMKPMTGKSVLRGDKSRDDEIKDKYENRMEEIQGGEEAATDAEG